MIRRADLQIAIDKASELRAMSPAVAEVLRVCGLKSVALKDVVSAIRVDHAIAVKILKLANSPIYTRGDDVHSIQHAVGRIGIQNIRQAVLNLAVMESFGSCSGGQLFDPGLFWEHSIATGLICVELSKGRKGVDSESAFTLGLVHDIGRVILADALGESYMGILRMADESGISTELIEKRLLLMDHGEVADRLLHTWRFPRELINPVAFHHSSPATIRKFAPQEAQQVMLLALANRLAKALILGASGNLMVYPTEETCELLRIGAAPIQAICANIPDLASDMKFALLSRSHAPVWPQVRDQLRALLPDGFRPIYQSASPEIDAIRIFCERLSDGSDASNPNLAIIHLRMPRDAATLWNAILKAETDAGCGPLPLIVLSPGAKHLISPTLTQGRTVLNFATPIHARRFAAAAAKLIAPNAQPREAAA